MCPDPSGTKICVTSPSKEQIEILAKVKRNAEWVFAVVSLQDGVQSFSPSGMSLYVLPHTGQS